MVNLTGLWSANDGGTYYLKQEGAALWWAGLSNDGLQNGLRFSNVFLGVVSEGEFGPESIDGRWVGVPRGTLMGTGALQLAINIDAAGNLVSLTKQGFSGGFHASLWLPVGKTAKAPNITEIFRLVKKNQNSDFPFPDHSLLDNLTPYRDHGVIFGKVVADPVNRPVHVNYRPDDGRQYQDFICLDDNQSPPDGDLNLEIQVDRVQLNEQTGFWTDGWTDGGSKFPANFKNKLDSGNNMLHLEAIMFGRVAECGDVQNYDLPPLLPGWQEQIGDSVLLSGQPMNGNVMIGAQDPLIGGYSATLTPMVKVGDYIRITGVLAMDIGHHGFFDAFRSDTEHGVFWRNTPANRFRRSILYIQ